MKDFYLLLQIPNTASASEIKAAYRKLSKKFHPDMNQGNKIYEDKFKDIQEAYSILKDPLKKKNYDIRLRDFNQQTARFRQSQQKFHAPAFTETKKRGKVQKKTKNSRNTPVSKKEIIWGAGIAATLGLIVSILIGIEKGFNVRESYLENVETNFDTPHIDSLSLIKGFRPDTIFTKTSVQSKTSKH